MAKIGSYTVVAYPKTVEIDDNTTSLAFVVDGGKSFDVDNAVAPLLIADLVTARPDEFLLPENIKLGVTIFGVEGTYEA